IQWHRPRPTLAERLPMRIGIRPWVTASIVVAIVIGRSASAQRPAAPRIDPAGPRTLVGVVVDTAGNRVDSAEVLIRSVARRRTTNADGRFRFDDLKPGTYDLTVRKLGFFPQVRNVRIGDNGGVARLEVVRRVFALPPAVSVATRLGLSGVV